MERPTGCIQGAKKAVSVYISVSRHATILSEQNKVAPLPTPCAMLFWPSSSRVISCVTANNFAIECFHSRGQHLCKFIGTKESVYIRKEFNSHRTSL